ncbi:retrovirus-related pol polyprotein from transposon TNT 1-94 [Tanacetum coccineum]
MMLDSIDNGPLVYPTVEEDGQTRIKKYSELTKAQQLQDDCDVQATNIILHGLPPDVYALGETLYEYYWRFSQLINDMHTIRMTMQQVPVNTKFLKALPLEWSKFVTDVKLAKSLYTTSYDQLYAYLSQHERHANEELSLQPFIPPSVSQQSQAEFPQLDSGLAVPMFQEGEDLIECINKAMAFLSAVASRLPPSNNQLRTSSNTRNQATIQYGRVTVQQVQGRQTQSYVGIGNRGIATTSMGNYAASQLRVVKCYNCQGEGHMVRQCTQPKRPRNVAWFKEKLMLAEAQEAGQILDEEQLSFLAYPRINEAPVAQHTIPQSSAFQTEYLDAYDLDCDDISSAKAIVIANISSCSSDVFSEVPYSDTYLNDMINQDVVIAKEHVVISMIDDEETLILKEESRSKMLDKQNDPISIEKKINISPIDYSKLNKIKEDFGTRFVTQKKLSTEQAFSLRHSSISETPVKSHTTVKVEAPSELPKISLVNKSLKKLKFQLANFDKVVKKRLTSDAITAGSWDETIEVQTVFNQMEAAVDQCSSCVDECTKYLEIETELFKKKDFVEKGVYDKLVKIIRKLKDKIKSLIGKESVENVKKDIDEIETINIDLEHTLKNELRKLKGKTVVDTAISKPIATIALGMFKLDIKPISHGLKNNMDDHEGYIEKTIENTNTLCGFVERAKTQNPSEPLLESACMFTKHIQELLVYVSQTCPNLPKPSEKLVVVTPLNKDKRVRFADPLTSLSNT